MASDALAHRLDSTVTPPAFDRRAATTRALLGYGVLVGPFYLATGIIQGLLRPGFDFRRHALSHLANGPGGWVQTANFAISGAMVVAAALGMARMLRPQSRASAWLLGTFGAGMLAASVFRADPVDGFPPGTPLGVPPTMSTFGVLHFIVGGVGFLALAASCFAMGVAMMRRGERPMALLSLAAGLGVVGGFFSPMLLPSGAGGIAGIWFSVVVGWAWLAATSIHLYRRSPDPHCAPSA